MLNSAKANSNLQSGTKVLDTPSKIKSLFHSCLHFVNHPLIQCWNYLAVVPNCVLNGGGGGGGGGGGWQFGNSGFFCTEVEHLLRKRTFAEMCQWFCP